MADVVVITGGTAGIGRATARAFARKGYAVGLIARGQERLEMTRSELTGMGVAVHAVAADVADAAAVEAAADAITAALGPISVWVNNAMATVYAPVEVISTDEFRRVTEVTYLGAVNGTKAALQRMETGTIVQVSSILAWRGAPIQGAYCGAKFALRGFTEALRSELIHDGSKLHVTMVHLPGVNTPQFDWARNKTGQETKVGSPYQPEVAADAIVYAATHKRRDVFVGSMVPPLILAARFAPSQMDKLLADQGYKAQLGDAPAPMQDGNLFEPAPGASQQARGRFSAQAKTRRDIYTSRQADVVAAGVLLLGAVGIQTALGAAAVAQARAARTVTKVAAAAAAVQALRRQASRRR